MKKLILLLVVILLLVAFIIGGVVFFGEKVDEGNQRPIKITPTKEIPLDLEVI